MGTSRRSEPTLSAAPAPRGVAPTPAHYEVDSRGHRVEGRGTTAPGVDLVRISSVLDVAALAGLCTHLVMTVEEVPQILLLAGLAAPVVPLILLYVSCASGMEDMTLRVRRILGILIPAMVIATASARERMEELLGASVLVQIPLLTMPFGAFAAHRALGLIARARDRASATRARERSNVARRAALAPTPALAPTSASAAAPRPAAVVASRPRSVLGTVVLVAGFVLLASGAVEATHRIWWFGFVFMAAGGLCVARSQDIGAPSSDRRLKRADRGNPAVWVFAPVGALVAAARAIWVLTTGF